MTPQDGKSTSAKKVAKSPGSAIRQGKKRQSQGGKVEGHSENGEEVKVFPKTARTPKTPMQKMELLTKINRKMASQEESKDSAEKVAKSPESAIHHGKKRKSKGGKVEGQSENREEVKIFPTPPKTPIQKEEFPTKVNRKMTPQKGSNDSAMKVAKSPGSAIRHGRKRKSEGGKVETIPESIPASAKTPTNAKKMKKGSEKVKTPKVEQENQIVQKRKDTKNSSTSSPDMTDKGKAALMYLRLFANDKRNWHFQKSKQIWLLRNMHLSQKVSEEDFVIMLKYLEGLKGRSRSLTQDKTGELLSELETRLEKASGIKKDEDTDEDTDEDDESSTLDLKVLMKQVKRAKQILQVLT